MTEIWDGAPEPEDVDLTTLSAAEMQELVKSQVDPVKAEKIVTQIYNSAETYELNVQRIAAIMSILQTGLGSALRIVRAS